MKLKCYFFDHLYLTTHLGWKKASGDHAPAFFFLAKPVLLLLGFLKISERRNHEKCNIPQKGVQLDNPVLQIKVFKMAGDFFN